jgi:hypothetical protein
MTHETMTGELIVDSVVVLGSLLLMWGLWRAVQPKPVFTIRVEDGKPHVVAGTVTPAFLERVGEVAAANGLSQVAVRGYTHGPLIRLRFSPGINAAARQQLLNWWASFGWAAPRQEQRDHTRCC